LRRWGLKLASTGGKRGKKRSIVAVARKLAVMLHRIWQTGNAWQAFPQAAQKTASKNACMALTQTCKATRRRSFAEADSHQLAFRRLRSGPWPKRPSFR
jgi:hypothetical protein